MNGCAFLGDLLTQKVFLEKYVTFRFSSSYVLEALLRLGHFMSFIRRLVMAWAVFSNLHLGNFSIVICYVSNLNNILLKGLYFNM